MKASHCRILSTAFFSLCSSVRGEHHAIISGEEMLGNGPSRSSSIARVINDEDLCCNEEVESRSDSHTCSVYLAPSSVRGASMGMFVTKAFKRGEIFHPADGPSIPIIEPDYGSARSREAWVDLFSGYWWGSGTTDPTLFEASTAVDYQITMGALPNSHPILNNLDVGSPNVVPYDDSMVDRSVDPGAGAFSYYMGRHSVAWRDIEAGEEIFLQYPDEQLNWLSEEYNIPNRDDYKQAASLLSALVKSSHGNIDSALFRFAELVASDFISERAASLLPKSQEDLDKILLSTNYTDDVFKLEVGIAKEISIEKRSVEWIKEHGKCLDNIIPGMSSNRQAGKGAIAQRPMKKGDVITPAPLLQVMDKDAFRLPPFKGEYNQLLLNYCFGRDDSSLLLCPNTNVILINHCSDRRPELHPCGKDSLPNAMYRWAEWDQSNDDWLKKSLEDMAKEDGSGLILEFIATRDIEEGEEIFIDYGEAWEKAWDQHLREWEPPVSARKRRKNSKWKSAKELNDDLEPLRITEGFSNTDVSADSESLLFTGCLYSYDEHEEDSWMWNNFDHRERWSELSLDEIITKYGVPAHDNFDVEVGRSYSDGAFSPCLVMKRHANASMHTDFEDDFYTVRILQPHNDYFLTEWHQKELPRIITGYPRSSIRHFYLPYKNMHLRNAFRHHIDFDENLFPSQWRDRM